MTKEIENKKSFSQMRRQNRNQNIFQAVLILALIIVLNILSTQVFFRADLTKEKRFSISDFSKQVLDSIDDDVYIVHHAVVCVKVNQGCFCCGALFFKVGAADACSTNWLHSCGFNASRLAFAFGVISDGVSSIHDKSVNKNCLIRCDNAFNMDGAFAACRAV